MSASEPPERPTAARFIEDLQSGGRYTFTLDEFSQKVGPSDTARQSALRRLKRGGRIVRPRREFYVIVPPEYRAVGAPPPSWYIDDLMRCLAHPYYVGLLSAASFHGAAHQSPQVFQVLTSIPTSPMICGTARIEFIRKRGIEQIAVIRAKTETGYMVVSTPESTVFDLVRHYRVAGHLSNVATVLAELADVISPEKLAAAAMQASQAEVQRAGYLFQTVGKDVLAARLETLLEPRRHRLSALRPDVPSEGNPVDTRWALAINEDVEADI